MFLGGLCVVFSHTGYCACISGYTGKRCQNTPPPTSTSTTTTTTTTTTSTTTVKTTFVVTSCTLNYCHSPQAPCIVINGVPQCFCPNGTIGPLCDSPTTTSSTTTTTKTTTTTPLIANCPLNYCHLNSAPCIVINNQPLCICPTGYTGPLCDPITTTSSTTTTKPLIANCPLNYCHLDSAPCIVINNQPMCICPMGYTGPLCDPSTG
jgi:hypothetical protein